MQQFDIRETTGKFILVLIIGVVFAAVGYMMYSSGAEFSLFVLLFGVVCAVFALWKLMQKGRSGIVFSPDSFQVELVTGEKYTYKYNDVELIALQEMTLPGYVKAIGGASTIATLFIAPANLVLLPEHYSGENTALALKFKPGVQIPQTRRTDTYLYSGDKLGMWTDENKLDLYYSFRENISFGKRKKLLQYLQNIAKQEIKVGPALVLK